MDAVVDLLPSPLDRPAALALSEDGTTVAFSPRASTAPTPSRRQAASEGKEPLPDDRPCALAFKVTHDRQRGPLVYFRVYSGTAPARP